MKRFRNKTIKHKRRHNRQTRIFSDNLNRKIVTRHEVEILEKEQIIIYLNLLAKTNNKKEHMFYLGEMACFILTTQELFKDKKMRAMVLSMINIYEIDPKITDSTYNLLQASKKYIKTF